MNAPTITLAGVPVQAPVTVLTNALLTMECLAFATVLRGRRGTRGRLWTVVFLLLALGALAGVPKHGIPHGSWEGLRHASRTVSDLGVASATTALVILAVGAHARRLWMRRCLAGLAVLQLGFFAILTALLRPGFAIVAGNSAVALVPVTPGAVRALCAGSRSGRWILGAVGTWVLSFLTYVAGVGVDAWIDHVDVSHALVMVAVLLLYRGALAEEEASWTT